MKSKGFVGSPTLQISSTIILFLLIHVIQWQINTTKTSDYNAVGIPFKFYEKASECPVESEKCSSFNWIYFGIDVISIYILSVIIISLTHRTK